MALNTESNFISRRQFLTTSGTIAGGMALASLTGCGVVSQLTSRRPPNIICFMADDMAPEYLGCYGGDIPTPNIDHLAQSGTRFDAAYCSASVCTPSRFSLLTGQYANRCDHPVFMTHNPVSDPACITWNTYLHANSDTIPRRLSQAGYQTGFAGKWHTSPAQHTMELPPLNPDDDPEDPTVDRFLQDHQRALIQAVKSTGGFQNAASVLWENWEQAPLKALRVHNMEWITHGALNLLDQFSSDQPFFLYVGATGIHGPDHSAILSQDMRLTPEGRFAEPFAGSLPRDSIVARLESAGLDAYHRTIGMVQVDDMVGALYDRLTAQDRVSNTIFIFLADHNTEPAKSTCYEKGVHAPLIIRDGRREIGGTSNQNRVQNVDISAYILAQAGVKTNSMLLDGSSAAVAASATQKELNRRLLYFENGYTRGISDGQYKYIAFRYPQHLLEQMKSGAMTEAVNHLNMPDQHQPAIAMRYYPGYFDVDQLYDLNQDPYEQDNRSSDPAYKQEMLRLQDELRRLVANFRHPFDLKDTHFQMSAQYRQLVAFSRARGTGHIPWWRDDFRWPPR